MKKNLRKPIYSRLNRNPMSYSVLMYIFSLNKNFDDLEELFKCTNKVFDK